MKNFMVCLVLVIVHEQSCLLVRGVWFFFL